jgi:phosphoglycerate dehydrogenase-like enzyme
VCEIPFADAEQDRLERAASAAHIEFRATDGSDHNRPRSDRDLSGAQVLISHWPPSDWTLAGGLRWIQTDSAGVDYLSQDAVWDRGVTLTNAAGAYAPQLAQFVLAGILAVAEKHSQRASAQRDHRWPGEGVEHDELIGLLLRGRVIVIVGYGGIGRETARLATAFGMRIIAVKANPAVRVDPTFCLPGTGDPEGVLPERIVGVGQLQDVTSLADFLVLSVPLTVETRGLVSSRVIAALPRSSWVVNVGRGAVIDQAALVTAVREGRVGGAILDVFEEEPLPMSSTIWELPNLVVTPHVAGGGGMSRVLFSHLVADNLRRYADGEPLLNVVDPRLRY